ncbi:MAG: type II toxin-antitoxin system PemK/MazF family toxin [Euryarchaeota archaeon]|nr:type II toxin-antitoxin system PemK/MazF family toxin [Euryarchaeota archaeon]
MKLEPGDVVLVPFPFADLSSRKTRPALVLSSAQYNATDPHVVLCGLTANLANAAFSVLVDPADVVGGTLPRASRVKVDRIVTVDQRLVRRHLGRLVPAALSQVWKEFHQLFGVSHEARK